MTTTHPYPDRPFRRCFTLNNAYRLTSGYGQKPGNAIAWLAGITTFFWAIYGGLASTCYNLLANDCKLDEDTILHSGAFAFRQLVSPFSAWRSLEPLPPTGYDVLTQTIASTQSLIGLSLASLFLLAVRWKFKRG